MKRECHTIQSLIQSYLKYEILDTDIQCHKCKAPTTTAQQFYIAKFHHLLFIITLKKAITGTVLHIYINNYYVVDD